MAQNLHLTLLFLGDQPEGALEVLHMELDAIPVPRQTLRPLAFAPLGSKVARAIVLDLQRDPALSSLQEQVLGATRRAGIAVGRARFRPHITLTRYSSSTPTDHARLNRALAALGPPDLPEAIAEPLTLWSSTLTPGGPIYDPLATYGDVAA